MIYYRLLELRFNAFKCSLIFIYSFYEMVRINENKTYRFIKMMGPFKETRTLEHINHLSYMRSYTIHLHLNTQNNMLMVHKISRRYNYWYMFCRLQHILHNMEVWSHHRRSLRTMRRFYPSSKVLRNQQFLLFNQYYHLIQSHLN